MLSGGFALLMRALYAIEYPRARTSSTWESVDQAITSEQTRLSVAVTRLGCASGKTGTVFEPLVTYEQARIVIRTTVVPLPKNVGHNCQGNDAVKVDIALAEPIGQRALVDAACLQDDASRTAMCVDSGVRWKPASG